MTILKKGSQGPDVVKLQQLLNKAGPEYSVKETGVFDGATLTKLSYFQATHINKEGLFLKVDGVVGVGGDETWWALENSKGASQKNWFDARIPDGLSKEREKLLKAALTEYGLDMKEVGNNDGPILKYGGKKGDPWCCFFVHWVVKETLGEWPTKKGKVGSCYVFTKAAEAEGKLTTVPHPGDAFLMQRWSGGKLVGGHTGFVLSVSKDGKKINTVEGNAGNRVKIGLRDVSTVKYYVNFFGDSPSGYEKTLLSVKDNNSDSMT